MIDLGSINNKLNIAAKKVATLHKIIAKIEQYNKKCDYYFSLHTCCYLYMYTV